MLELNKSDFKIVSRLFENIEHSKAMVFSVIDGNSNGRIFVDSDKNPRDVFIYQEGGFMYLLSEDELFIEAVENCIQEDLLKSMNEKEMVLFSFSKITEEKLSELFKDKGAIWIERKMFRFNRGEFENLLKIMEAPSKEYKIEKMTTEDIKSYNFERNLGCDSGEKIGFKVVKDSKVVGKCVSIFLGKKEAEVDIEVSEEHRGKGLAKACSVEFIKECLKEDNIPSWSCWPFREESIALAKKLGFEECEDLKVRFWAENM